MRQRKRHALGGTLQQRWAETDETKRCARAADFTNRFRIARQVAGKEGDFRLAVKGLAIDALALFLYQVALCGYKTVSPVHWEMSARTFRPSAWYSILMHTHRGHGPGGWGH